MKTRTIGGTLLCCALVLGGCATSPGVADADSIGKLRHGWISGVYTADTPKSALPRCLADLSPEQFGDRRFVKIDYRHVRQMRVEVAELPVTPDTAAVPMGAHVELIPHDCAGGELSRITKFLR